MMPDTNSSIVSLIKKSWKNSSILRNTSITFLLRVSGALLLLIFNWLVVKILGVGDSGVFFIAFTLLNIVSTLSLFGVDQYSLRRISTIKQAQKAKIQFIKGGQLILLSSLSGALILFLLADYMSHFFDAPTLAGSLRYIALTVPFITLITYLGHVVRAKKKFGRSTFILTNSYYLLSVFMFGLFWILGKTSLEHISAAFLLALVIGLVIDLFLTLPVYQIATVRELAKAYTTPTIKSLAAKSYSLFVVSAIYLGIGSATVLMVGYFLSNADVSIFSVSEKIAKLLTFSLFAINIVLAPSISRLFHEKNLNKLNQEVQKTTILSIAFASPLLLLLLVFPGFVLAFFGQEYTAGANTLRILVLGQAVNAGTGAVLIIMTMISIEKKLNYISFSSLLINLVLGAILIPRYGIIGAGWSAAISNSYVNIVGAYHLKRHHSIRVLPTRKELGRLTANAKNSFS